MLCRCLKKTFQEPFDAHVLPLRDDIDSDDGNPDGNPVFGPLPDRDHSLRRQAQESGSDWDRKTSRESIAEFLAHECDCGKDCTGQFSRRQIQPLRDATYDAEQSTGGGAEHCRQYPTIKVSPLWCVVVLFVNQCAALLMGPLKLRGDEASTQQFTTFLMCLRGNEVAKMFLTIWRKKACLDRSEQRKLRSGARTSSSCTAAKCPIRRLCTWMTFLSKTCVSNVPRSLQTLSIHLLADNFVAYGRRNSPSGAASEPGNHLAPALSAQVIRHAWLQMHATRRKLLD